MKQIEIDFMYYCDCLASQCETSADITSSACSCEREQSEKPSASVRLLSKSVLINVIVINKDRNTRLCVIFHSATLQRKHTVVIVLFFS